MDTLVMMLCFIEFVPLSFLISGLVIWRNPQPFGGLGYRTARAEKNEQTWHFAQVTWGRIAFFSNIPVLMRSAAAAAIAVLTTLTAAQLTVMLLIIAALIVADMAVSIAATEKKLADAFDKNGTPRG